MNLEQSSFILYRSHPDWKRLYRVWLKRDIIKLSPIAISVFSSHIGGKWIKSRMMAIRWTTVSTSTSADSASIRGGSFNSPTGTTLLYFSALWMFIEVALFYRKNQHVIILNNTPQICSFGSHISYCENLRRLFKSKMKSSSRTPSMVENVTRIVFFFHIFSPFSSYKLQSRSADPTPPHQKKIRVDGFRSNFHSIFYSIE